MVRTSKKRLKAEAEARAYLAEFRRTPRLVCVEFTEAAEEPSYYLKVSVCEEPPVEYRHSGERALAEMMKAQILEHEITWSEEAAKPQEARWSPWGEYKVVADDVAPPPYDGPDEPPEFI